MAAFIEILYSFISIAAVVVLVVLCAYYNNSFFDKL